MDTKALIAFMVLRTVANFGWVSTVNLIFHSMPIITRFAGRVLFHISRSGQAVCGPGLKGLGLESLFPTKEGDRPDSGFDIYIISEPQIIKEKLKGQ